MKHISEYLRQVREASDDVKVVNELIVRYHSAEPLTLEVPKSFSIDDTLVYIDDMYLNDMPGNNDISKEVIGKNKEYISDTYFDVTNYTVEPHATKYVDYDSKIGGQNADTEELDYCTLKDFDYVISFSKFELKNTDDIKRQLEDIFKNFIDFKFPVRLILDSNSISFR